MATETFQDSAILSRLLDDALSPISNYSQGLLSLALRRKAREELLAERQRERDERVADQLRARGWQEEDIKKEQEFRAGEAEKRRTFESAENMAAEIHAEKMVDLHAKAQSAARVEEFNLLDAAQKKQRREDALSEARALGVGKDRLSESATYGEIQEALAKSRGRQLVESANTYSTMLGRYAAYKGQTQKQVIDEAMSQAIGQLSPKSVKEANLTSADLDKLLKKPSVMTELRTKAIREKNDKGFALLNQINAEFHRNVETGMVAAEKSKPDLAGLAEAARGAREVYEKLAVKGGYDEASSLEASKALTQSVFQGLPQSAPEAEPRPLPLPGLGPTGGPLRPPGQPFVDPRTGAVSQPAPAQAAPPNTPYGLLQQMMSQEQAGAAPGGSLLPSWMAGSGAPLTDAWFNTLAGKVGVQPQGVGSSVFSTPAGSVLRSQMATNPGISQALDAISQDEANKLAMTTLSQYASGLPASSPSAGTSSPALPARYCAAPVGDLICSSLPTVGAASSASFFSRPA